MNPHSLWRPRASLSTLRARADLYARLREFFAERGVLEVETPVLSQAATVDPNIDSYVSQNHRWLQTSPEFPMKRLLAAGSGAIYQIARVFRCDEAGRFHNPEFSLLEWYRPGFDHLQLMDEIEALFATLGVVNPAPFERLTYRAAFQRYAGLDSDAAHLEDLRAACKALPGGMPEPPESDLEEQRNFYLDLLMSAVVSPRLGVEAPVFLLDFPASQAALARVRADTPPVAERFELFWHGIELANGFHELRDADEQRRRFEHDRARRIAAGRVAPPYDAHLISALHHGFPDCAGVALGLDRLLMRLLGLDNVGDTLAFDDARA
jgi:elongation factor P--(R)-beta-lysine ligase